MEELKQKGTAIVGEVFTSFWKEKVSCEVGRERDLACKGREEASAPGKISFVETHLCLAFFLCPLQATAFLG